MAAKYDAFISYKHSPHSQRVAIALEKALKRYAKPALSYPRRIFRDEQILRPGDDLSKGIRTALGASEYLLYLATEESARSKWVRDEIVHWCRDLRRVDRLIMIHLSGSIAFSKDQQSIDWDLSDALIPDLKEYLPSLPLFVDMTWFRTEEDGDLQNLRFKELINGIVAKLRGVTPEELNGEAVKIYRRNRRLRISGVAAISTLTVATSALAFITWSQRNEARRELRANELATYALQMEESDDTKAFSVLARAYKTKDTLPIRKLIYDWYTTKTMYAQELRFPGHGVSQVDWSINKDILVGHGGTVTVLCEDGTRRTISPQAQAVMATSFYDQGRKIMTAGFSGVVSGWESRSGKRLWTHSVGDQFSEVSISPDGQYLVVLTLNRGDLLVSLPAGERILALNEGFGAGDAVAFSPDSRSFAVARKSKVIIYGLDGHSRIKPFDLHGQSVGSLAFSSDGRFLVSGGWDEMAVIWDLHDEGWQRLQGHSSPINAVAISHDGSRVATGGQDGRIFIWDHDGNPLVTIAAHGDAIAGLRFSADGQWLISGGGTHERARIWAVENLDQSSLRLSVDAYETFSVEFSPDGQQFLTAGQEGKLKIWSARDGDLVRSLSAEGVIRGVYGPEGKNIAAIGRGKILTWNEKFELIGEIDVGAIDGRFLAREQGPPLFAFLARRTLQVRKLDGTLVAETGLQENPKCLATSPDGRWIVTGATDNVASLWSAELSLKAELVGHSSHISSVAFSNDGRYIATGSYDKTAKVWDLQGRLLANLEGGHTGYVLSVAFSPDGDRLFTGGYEHPGIGVIWNWQDGFFEKRLQGHAKQITTGDFSPQGNLIATGDRVGNVRLWSADPTLEEFLGTNRMAVFSDQEIGLAGPEPGMPRGPVKE